MTTIILRILSKLPLSWLYILSTLLRFVLEHIVGYRKSVIRNNLKRSFPNLSHSKIDELQHAYYVHLCDLMVETVKLISISEHELKDRIRFSNPEILSKFEKSDSGVIIMMGHSGNWEWAGALTSLTFQFKCLPVYRKVKNSSVDKLFVQLRSRFGSEPVLDKAIATTINQKSNVAVAMLADQTPSSRKGWWVKFLNQPTPFFRGSEILASRNKSFEVVYAHVHKVKRGYYSIVLEDAPSDWRDHPTKLTKCFAEWLETEIKKDPANWLWSHRRWKHKPNDKSRFID